MCMQHLFVQSSDFYIITMTGLGIQWEEIWSLQDRFSSLHIVQILRKTRAMYKDYSFTRTIGQLNTANTHRTMCCY